MKTRLIVTIAKLSVAITVPASSALVACRDAGSPVTLVTPKVHAATSTSVTGKVATVVSPAPTVVVTDSLGRAAAGVHVRFTRQVEGTSTELGTVTTGSDGRASVEWRLGTKAVSEVLYVSADGYIPIWFRARVEPGPAATLQRVAGDAQQGIAGFALNGAIRVSVTDSLGNGVSGVYVEFEVEQGGGSVINAPGLTDSAGIATARWILGQAGANSLRAAVPGIGEIRFSATAQEPPPTPNGAKYELNRIRFTGDYVTKLPSWLVLGDDGRFMMYVQWDTPLLGLGTYTVSNSRIRLTYADSSFLPALWASLSYFPPDIPPMTFGNVEDGVLENGTLVFHRCWTEECYDCYWEYMAVP